MQLADILTRQRTTSDEDLPSKKKVLEYLSELLATAGADLEPGRVFDCLVARERLGTTGIGRGVAIPHCRCAVGDKVLGAFVRTREQVDFDSPDQMPVNLFFALLVPKQSSDEHLAILGHLARLFSDESVRATLRSDCEVEEIYQVITQWRDAADD